MVHHARLYAACKGTYEAARRDRQARPPHPLTIGMNGALLSRVYDGNVLLTGLERYIDEITQGVARSEEGAISRLYTRIPFRPDSAPGRFENIVVAENKAFHHRIFSDLGHGDLDVFHVPYVEYEPMLLGPIAVAPASVVTIHDIIPIVLPGYHTPFSRMLYRAMVRFAARQADAIIVDSRHSASDLVRFTGMDASRIHVVFLGYDPRFNSTRDAVQLDRVRSKYKLPQRYVFCLARPFKHKNVPTLIRAMAAARAMGANCDLVLAGPRDYIAGNEEVAQTVREVGGESWVHVIGAVDDLDLPYVYQAAEIFAFPSRYEGFGIPVLEAMACGTPVISSNSTSLPEVVGDGGILLDTSSPEPMAKALAEALASSELRGRLSEQGLNRAKLFSWDTAAKETIAAYNTAIERGRAAGKRP